MHLMPIERCLKINLKVALPEKCYSNSSLSIKVVKGTKNTSDASDTSDRNSADKLRHIQDFFYTHQGRPWHALPEHELEDSPCRTIIFRQVSSKTIIIEYEQVGICYAYPHTVVSCIHMFGIFTYSL